MESDYRFISLTFAVLSDEGKLTSLMLTKLQSALWMSVNEAGKKAASATRACKLT